MKLFMIGEHSEIYAASSESEMRKYFVELVGEEEAESSIADLFEEIPESLFDKEFKYDDDGKIRTTTWRKELKGVDEPTQMSTGYN